jgi:hypothetical protein
MIDAMLSSQVIENYGTVKTANARSHIAIYLLVRSQYRLFLKITRIFFFATAFSFILAEPSSVILQFLYNPELCIGQAMFC